MHHVIHMQRSSQYSLMTGFYKHLYDYRSFFRYAIVKLQTTTGHAILSKREEEGRARESG